MATGHASCGHNGHTHDDIALEEKNEREDYNELDLAFDPTLASCCERDEHEYKKAMKLKALLTTHDRTSGAVRMRQELFQPPPATCNIVPQPLAVAPRAPPSRVSTSDSDYDDSDDEFGVEAMLAARRKQLEQQLEKAAQDAADGYGVVLNAELSQLVQELRDEPDVPKVVLVVGSNAIEQPRFVSGMSGEMAAVAQKFLGTKFFVVVAPRNDDEMLRILRLPLSSSLAAFRRGERVDSIALDPSTLVTELEAIWEARFLPWLSKCSVLVSERQVSNQNHSGNSCSKMTAEEAEKEDSGYDCGVKGCRLRYGYEHEHVGTSQQTKDEISAWRHTPG